MKRTLILGTALALMLGTATTTMHPVLAAKGAGKAGKAGKAGGAGKGKREKMMQAMTPDMLGKVLGTPLTDEQATAVKDANKAYGEAVAKAVGLTADDLKAKIAAYHKANPGGKKAGAATTAPATTPPATP